jgi:ribosomal protein S18 acetylase RimI-like enzyme
VQVASPRSAPSQSSTPFWTPSPQAGSAPPSPPPMPPPPPGPVVPSPPAGPLEVGPPDVAFLAAHLNADRAVCALLDGQLVGLAGYQLGGRSLTGGSASAVLRTYGHLRGLHRLALLALFERHPAPGQLVMDGIAVDPGTRGRGIGTLLLEEVAAVAAEQDCREIRLDVIDTNPRARALYERRGFTAVRTEHTPYLRGLLGFGAATTMRRPVGANGPRGLHTP